MRNLPIDSTQLGLISAGKVLAKPAYGEMPDGSRRRIPGQQDTDSAGLPIWLVDCFVDDEDEDARAEVISVAVSSYERPVVKKFERIQFVGLVARMWVPRGTTNVAMSFRAMGVASSQLKASA